MRLTKQMMASSSDRERSRCAQTRTHSLNKYKKSILHSFSFLSSLFCQSFFSYSRLLWIHFHLFFVLILRQHNAIPRPKRIRSRFSVSVCKYLPLLRFSYEKSGCNKYVKMIIWLLGECVCIAHFGGKNSRHNDREMPINFLLVFTWKGATTKQWQTIVLNGNPDDLYRWK